MTRLGLMQYFISCPVSAGTGSQEVYISLGKISCFRSAVLLFGPLMELSCMFDDEKTSVENG